MTRVLNIMYAAMALLWPAMPRLAGAVAAGSVDKQPLTASFFGAVSGGESTDNFDLDPSKHQPESLLKTRGISEGLASSSKNAEFFRETMSMGDRQAWQTFPEVPGANGNNWRQQGSGRVVQEYKPATYSGQKKTASWFDTSVRQYDKYGRIKAPYPGSPQRLALWEERSVNTTLTCKDPGCSATSLLYAPFNSDNEMSANCKLNLDVHPTDFDDHYSGERLTEIRVNDRVVNTDCFPMVSACNKTTQDPTFSCLKELELDHLLDGSGTIKISAQISDVVDECPYEGNLLSAIPKVTCMVTPKQLAVETAPPPVAPVSPTLPDVAPPLLSIYAKKPISCASRGCIAFTEFVVNDTALPIDECRVNVRLYQTDFDGEQGTVEEVEYVMVNGESLLANYKPGLNPCKKAWAGTPLTLLEKEFSAVTDHVVTNATDGRITVTAKISPLVDECAHEGYLLNGFVEANCSLAWPELQKPADPQQTGRSSGEPGLPQAEPQPQGSLLLRRRGAA